MTTPIPWEEIKEVDKENDRIIYEKMNDERSSASRSNFYQSFIIPLLVNRRRSPQHEFIPILQAGGIAGLTADVVLFPLDTIKTRLQSSRGFLASGGFHKIYAGIGPAAAGSAPSGTYQRNSLICQPSSSLPFSKKKKRI